ncbi:MAG: ABC transporter ATP-binding protein [Acidimicrobiia bacterium]
MTQVLEVRNLSMRFGMVTAAEALEVTVQAGELVGIIGPNGAGKTSFLNLITGYTRPDGGTIKLFGRDISRLSPDQVTALGVGRSFQLFLDMTVMDNVLIALGTAEGAGLGWRAQLRQPRRLERASAILGRFDMGHLAGRAVSEIAEGTRKLLDVALAFALRPTLLLMDEPTSGVSIDDKFEVMDTLVAVLREEGITAMFVEHDMEVVRRYSDRVLVLSEGRIIGDGPPEDVLSDEAIRRSVAGWH